MFGWMRRLFKAGEPPPPESQKLQSIADFACVRCPHCGTTDESRGDRICRFCGKHMGEMNEMSSLAEALATGPMIDASRVKMVPKKFGIYAWFFKGLDENLTLTGCFNRDSWYLMYIGKAAKSTLFSRANDHFNGDTVQSGAVREAVGALLAKKLTLRHFRKGDDWMLEGDGERRLTEWLKENARIAWVCSDNFQVRWPRGDGETDEQMIGRCEKLLINSYFRVPLNRDQVNKEICREVTTAWANSKLG